MRQLLLLRHAKSSWDDPRLDDHARPLNRRGRASAVAMRGVLRNLGILPDLVMVSTSLRTTQTLEALEPWEETPLVEPLAALYLADAAQLLAAVHEVPETVRSVMVIGHNPGLHELAMNLLGPQVDTPDDDAMRALIAGYPTGALAEFSVTGRWANVGESPARLERFIDPRELEQTEPTEQP